MKKIITFFIAVLLTASAFAEDLVLSPTTYKKAPSAATSYLTSLKLKPKKAKWSVATQGAYVAEYPKKGEAKMAYIFSPEGRFLFKRTPIQESDLPKGMSDVTGDRMKAPGSKLYLFEGQGNVKMYAISVPVGNGLFSTHYITPEGRVEEMYYK